MGKLFFKAELLDDVVLSQSTATVGGHKSLDYIPGSIFLGVAASRFYSQIGEEKAWSLFHTSKVHFCNAYPLVDGKRAIPMPLAFHSEKVPRDEKKQSIMNFTHPEAKEKGIQYKQSRNGYITFADECKVHVALPSKTSRMRTAIDASTGTAAKSQLYGYESIDEDQVFVGKIEWDDSVQDIVAPVVKLFESGEIIHSGRSKAASYGRIKISKIDISETEIKADKLKGDSFSILAVSDLCLRNTLTGAPEMSVSPACLGLGSNWQMDKTRSFARTSCLYQFNAFRREIEIQKNLISKGSVFTFKSDKEITAEEKEAVLCALCKGIGEFKGQGFGEIALYNIGKAFSKEDSQDKVAVSSQILSEENQAWLSWLTPDIVRDVEYIVNKAVNDFVDLCTKIKAFNTFDDAKVFWPQRAQWGRILDCSRMSSSKEELYNQLFEEDSPVIKPIKTTTTERNKDTKIYNPDPEWNYEASSDGTTLRKWLMAFVADQSINDTDTKKALQEIAKRCQDKIADKNWLKDGAK